MRSVTKWVLASVAVLAIAAAGYAAAAGTNAGAAKAGKGHPGPLAVFKVCTDDTMTVKQCKDLVKQRIQERIDAAYQKCLEKRSQSFCDGKKQAAQERLAKFDAAAA